MLGYNGLGLSEDLLKDFGTAGTWLAANGFANLAAIDNHVIEAGTFWWLAALLFIVWAAPNTQQVMNSFEPAMESAKSSPRASWLVWRPTPFAAAAVCVIAVIALANLSKYSAFLYFQF